MTEWIEARAIGDVLLRTAHLHPDREAIVFPERRYTYAEVADRARAVARGLIGLGVRCGDAVGILMPNCPEFAFCFYGAQMIGAVVVPINARFRTRELGYVAADADLKVILTSDIIADHVDFAARLQASLDGLADSPDPRHLELAAAPSLRTVVLLGDRAAAGMLTQPEFEGIAAGVEPDAVETERWQVRVRDIALLPYTSGTTSQPKGVLLTHEAFYRDWATAGRRLRVGPNERFWDPLPMFHMSGLGPLLFCFDVGATFISQTHFEAGQALDLIERERVTWLYPSYATITMNLARHPTFAQRDLSAVRGMLNVGPTETMRVMQEAFPMAVQINCYGLTEASGVVTFNEWDDTLEERVATTGIPLPGVEVRVVDPETLQEVPEGTMGEIQVRGYSTLEAYHKDPVKTSQVLLDDGWLRTGDIGTMAPGGRLVYSTRLKDMLKVGGENVSPAEIESQLSRHPAVKVVAVVGVPDDRLDEVPVAFVESSPGAQASEEELIAFCAGAMASFKVPRRVHFVTEWPMSATKIQKFRLREMAIELG